VLLGAESGVAAPENEPAKATLFSGMKNQMSSWLTKKEKDEEQPEAAKEEVAEAAAGPSETEAAEKAAGEEVVEGAEGAAAGNLVSKLYF